jgi:hypothetical protein
VDDDSDDTGDGVSVSVSFRSLLFVGSRLVAVVVDASVYKVKRL